jgi:hypothetical protein
MARTDNVTLHNVAEFREQPDGGITFQRVPETVRAQLNEHARERALDTAGTEIRFVMAGPRAEVRLHATWGTAGVQVFFGDFRVNQEHIVGGDMATIAVDRPNWFLSIPPDRLAPLGFAPCVCRVQLIRGSVCFHEVNGDVRPPRREELPAVRFLAYGTSITQGAGASMRHLCFAAQTATRLRADLLNLGFASACHCEPAIADYMAARDDWDVALLEISTNMAGFTLDEFGRRTGYMVNAMAAPSLKRLVACMTLFPKTADLGRGHLAQNCGGTPEQYRQVLREVARECGRANVLLFEGRELLPEWRGLATELLHPSDYGHTIIAENLARQLAERVPGLLHCPAPDARGS